MSNELNYLLSRAVKGLMSRREFVGRAGALGVMATTANALLATAARAEGPKKGGHAALGLAGGGKLEHAGSGADTEPGTL